MVIANNQGFYAGCSVCLEACSIGANQLVDQFPHVASALLNRRNKQNRL
jgi:hypothetical protein